MCYFLSNLLYCVTILLNRCGWIHEKYECCLALPCLLLSCLVFSSVHEKRAMNSLETSCSFCMCYPICHHIGSGVTGRGQGAECPPETSDRENFADLLGKKRQGKNGKGRKTEKKKRKIVKGKVET